MAEKYQTDFYQSTSMTLKYYWSYIEVVIGVMLKWYLIWLKSEYRLLMVVKKTENGKLQKCISSILGLSIFFYSAAHMKIERKQLYGGTYGKEDNQIK